MKFCPTCQRVYEDEMMNYCLDDGASLIGDFDTMATLASPYMFVGNSIQTEAYTSQNMPKFQPSIAVMPFANVSAEADNEYFCDGLTEELLNALAKIEGVKVVARTSAFSLKGKNISVSEIGQLLNVNSILEGSVRRAGNRLRITVQLVSAHDGFQLWSEKYDREMKDIFHVQDEITLAATEALKVKLFGENKRAVLKRYTDNTKAYELFLKGIFERGKGGTDRQKKAVGFFERAVALDMNYALAYAELAFTYRVLLVSGAIDPKEFMPKAERAARRALELDDEIAEGHFALAFLEQDAWRWESAGREFRLAIELNANLARARVGYAGHLSRVGRHDEAVAEVKLARELDPLSLIVNTNVGFILYFARRHDEAIETLKRTLEMDASFAFAHLYLAYNYAAKGAFDEAIAAYQKAIELGKVTPSNQIYLGAAYARKGERKKALAILKQLLTGEGYVSQGELAVIYAALDKRKEAFASLEKAFVARDLQLQYLNVDPGFDGLRGDSRFENLLNRVGFPK
jgi:serine/threonine-protein kinase